MIIYFITDNFSGTTKRNTYFNSLDNPKLRDALKLTLFCIPYKLIYTLFNIKKITCLNNMYSYYFLVYKGYLSK